MSKHNEVLIGSTKTHKKGRNVSNKHSNTEENGLSDDDWDAFSQSIDSIPMQSATQDSPQITPQETPSPKRRKSVQSRLKDLGYSKEAIARIENAQHRLRIPEDDTAFAMLLELEGYIRIFEKIPQTIEETHKSASIRAKQHSEETLNQLFSKMSDDWMKRSKQLLDDQLRLNKASMVVFCVMVLLAVSATSMAFYAFLNGKLASFMAVGHITGITALDWFIQALHAPVWSVMLVLLVVFSLIKTYQYGARLKERDD